MVLKPVSVSNVICYIIGGVIAVFGTSFLINYFKTPDSAGGKAILVISLIMIMLGAYIIFNPTTFASIIPLITGVFVLVDALNKIRMALQLKSLNSSNWIQVLICGVIMLILLF